MKKIISFVIVMSMLLCMGVAYAFNWTDVEAEKCTEYVLTAEKYVKTNADIGAAYTKAPDATAKVGDVVYFYATATDVKGNSVDADIEYHHLGNIEKIGKIFRARVVGSEPYVKISITEKTPISELTYKGDRIYVNDDTVRVGKLTFQRNSKGTVIDVQHDVNAAEMIEDLADLNITVNDVYGGKVCMSNDALISNFGKICETEKIVCWYIPSYENPELGIPKTGDKPLFYWISWLWGK